YNALGRRIRTYTGDSNSPTNDTHYGYDALSRLATVTVVTRNGQQLSTPELTSYFYDLMGNLALQRQANGVVVAYTYDSLNRLHTLTQYAPDSTPNDLSDNPKVAEFDYTVRADGQRTYAIETFWFDGQAHVNQIHWS